MDTSELDIFLQQEDSKNIQLRNLSSINQSVTEYAYFEPKRSYYPRLFKVIVSLHQENKDYVTIDIKKNLNDCDPLNRFAYDIITWTFSIIDIEGVGRYYQSFTKENIVHFPYVIQIPDFVKKTVIFEQADELIPNGILTISCEVSFMSYPGPAIEKNHRLGCWTFEEYRPQVREKRKEEEICLNNDCEKIIYENEKKLVNDMFHFLKTIEKYKEDDLEEKSVEYWKKTLLRDLASDELFRTYLHFNPIFQTYSRLKRKLMILLGVFPEYANLEDLEPEFHIPWTQTRLKFKRRFKIQKEKVDKTKANLKKIKHQSGTLNEEDNIAEIDDEWKVFVSLVEHELENDIEYDITGISRCNNDDKWNFIVETEDGISFTLPFKNNQETLGSKLASSSSIFKNMLRNPMKEKHEKKVKLVDVNSQTFIDILHFLQGLEIKHRSLPPLCDLYEFADKYEFKELMYLCAAWMRPLFTSENINKVEMLSYLHSDVYLHYLVESYKKQNMILNATLEKCLKNNSSLSDIVPKNHFEFYK